MDRKKIAHEKEINAAHKFIVGQISQVVAKKFDIRVAPTVTEAIVKLSQGYLEEVAADAEAFSKHAKRNTVQSDDVYLIARKNPRLVEHLKETCAKSK